MKLLRKIGAFAAYVIVVPVMVVVWGSIVLLPGLFTLAFIEDAFSIDWLADHRVLRLVAAAPIGGPEILCGYLIWRAWKRKRAIEEETKPVLDIQILEPPPPDPVERFYGHDGPIERFFDRYFSWTEDAGDKLGELLEALPFSVKCVGVLTVGFLAGAVTLWVG